MRIRVWVGTSRAGKGLFAAQHLKKGTRIIQDIGPFTTQNITVYVFNQDHEIKAELALSESCPQ